MFMFERIDPPFQQLVVRSLFAKILSWSERGY